MTTTFIQQLADFVVNHDLNPSKKSRRALGYALFDTFGCMLVGATSEVARLTRAVHRDQLGDGQSEVARVYGTSLSASPETAAFLNATAAHAFDMDDWEVPGNSHASAILLPAILAAGSNSNLSGEQVASAYLAGNEVIATIGEAINFDHYARGWHATGTLASIGAAAAVAKLWKLSLTETANAISIAVARAAGLTKQFGSHTKAMQAGFAAENAVRAATLAKHGLTGQMDVLEGPQGYFSLTGDPDSKKHAQSFARLGKRLAIDEYGIVIKPYPSCGYTHRLMDCARKLFDSRLNVNDIASVHLYLPDFHAAILPYQQPENLKEALFSLPFCVGHVLLKNRLSIQDLEEEAWQDKELKNLIPRIKVTSMIRVNPDMNYDPEQPDRMELRLKNDTTLYADTAYPLGSPQNPLSEQELVEKFIDNARRIQAPKEQDVVRLLGWQAQINIYPLLEAFAGGSD